MNLISTVMKTDMYNQLRSGFCANRFTNSWLLNTCNWFESLDSFFLNECTLLTVCHAFAVIDSMV